jgi:F420-dependent oxidoreductase-like protein
VRFSIWPNPSKSWTDIVESARNADSTGWDGIWFSDHFMSDTNTEAPGQGTVRECLAMVAGLAAVVPTLRLGTLVLGVPYRHPAILANAASAIDQISDGRFVLGVGAGWQANEHVAYGIPFSDAATRLQRLEEACQVLVGLLRDESTTLLGEHYQLRDAPRVPPTVQDRLPLLIGGGGERVLMRIAAQYADEWNTWATPEQMQAKVEVLHKHCDSLGRDPSTIKVSTQALLFMSDDEEWLAPRRAHAASGAPGPPMMVGTPAELVEIVAGYQKAGVDELIVPDFTLGGPEECRETYGRFLNEVAAGFRK